MAYIVFRLHPLCGFAMREEDTLFDEVEPMETTTSGVCCKLFALIIALKFVVIFSVCCE